jgi:hypothetical protein
MTRRTGLKGSSVDRKVGVAVDLLLPERPHAICPQFVQTSDWRCPASHPQLSEMVSFMITSPGPARDTCDHLRCCHHRHDAKDSWSALKKLGELITTVRREVRLTLKKNGLPTTGELFDRAYAYSRATTKPRRTSWSGLRVSMCGQLTAS